MPPNQSSPVPSLGARLAKAAVPVTRSGSSAAQARACGPPPERPTTAKVSTPNASATAAESWAASATVRPGARSESP